MALLQQAAGPIINSKRQSVSPKGLNIDSPHPQTSLNDDVPLCLSLRCHNQGQTQPLSHCKGKQAHTTNEISGLKEVELTELPFLIPHVAMLSYTSLLANSPSTLRCVENYV